MANNQVENQQMTVVGKLAFSDIFGFFDILELDKESWGKQVRDILPRLCCIYVLIFMKFHYRAKENASQSQGSSYFHQSTM